MEIQLKSRWLERCIRDYLGIADRAITEEDVSVIKYLYVSTTDGYFVGFGKGTLPGKFDFSDAGDEWSCCCLSDTAKYHRIEEFIDIRDWGDCKDLSIKRELLEEEAYGDEELEGGEEPDSGESENGEEPDSEELESDEEFDGEEEESGDETAEIQDMEDFERSVRMYEPVDSDFEGLVQDEKTYDYGILVPDDFAQFVNLEVVRLMSCETEIHSLAFLKSLPKLRVLEVGEVRLNTLEGLEKLVGLEKLCIWAN